jgi:hypothetical protein
VTGVAPTSLNANESDRERLTDKAKGDIQMVTKKEKAQASDRSGSGARGKTHTGGGRDQQGGGKKASSGGTSKGGGQPGGGKTGGQGG